MADSERSCRICRGEASDDQPLIHPCKCRGSIKYIHQDCLMEWLNHSNKSTKQCDICNTPYKFRTIYDPHMPASMPLDEIWRKVHLSIALALVRYMSMILYVACAVHIPLFWKFVGRVFTYALDGKLPLPDLKITHVLLYGAYTTRALSGALLAGPDATVYDKLEAFVANTFVSGVLDVIAFMVVLFVAFVEHEWVVREEGYTKSLLRHIGKEPRTKLADLLSLMVEQAGDNEAARELMVNRALEDIQHLPDFHLHEAMLRQALNQGHHDDLILGDRNARRALPGPGNNAPGDTGAGETQNPEIAQPESHAHEGNHHGGAEERAQDSARVAHAHEAANGIDAGHASQPDSAVQNAQPANAHQNAQPADDGVASQTGNAEHDGADTSDSSDDEYRPLESDSEYESSDDERPSMTVLYYEDDFGEFDRLDHIYDESDDDEHRTIDLHNESDIEEHPTVNLHDDNEEHPTANLPDESDNEAPEELERRRNLAEDELAAAQAVNNGDILELFGIRFNLIAPIQLMILADFIVLVFLFFVYLIPHFMGNMAAMIALATLIGVHALAVKPLMSYLLIPSLTSIEEKLPFLSPGIETASDLLVKPALELLKNLGTLDRVHPPTFVERVILLSIGYSLICGAIYLLMTTLVAGKKPIIGNPRRIFKVLFQIAATAKVFTIFAIEIVIFPIYCGWLLDFCMVPLLEEHLQTTTDSGTSYTFLRTSIDLSGLPYGQALAYWLWNPYLRPLTLWGYGTCYMFFVALFVGMIRNNILRPGVLFFIKSPEDPNARLIHDALVKPFFLQALRIFLSAKVYTAFIVIGIGSFTWGLRYFVNAPGSTGKDSALLPIQFDGWSLYVQVAVTVFIFGRAKPLVSKYCKLFWTRAFEALCYKLRLSHFILGHPVAQERGHIVYRNLAYRILGLGIPDYSRPVSYSEAMEIFKTDPTVSACFVPDGHYVRAPATDDNSRKFLRGLFVPVTKSDKLLTPAPEVPDDDESDWWDADIVYEDTYTVVYQPPNLRARSIALVCLICAFGALLIIVCALVAVLVGRPTWRASMIVGDLPSLLLKVEGDLPSKSINWKYINLRELCWGLQTVLGLLLYIDYQTDRENALNFIEEQQRRLAVPAGNLRGEFLRIPIKLLTTFVPAVVALAIHYNYLAKIEEYYFGTSTFIIARGSAEFNFSWHGVLLHFALIPWTIVPLLKLSSAVHHAFSKDRKMVLLQSFGSMMFLVLHRVFEYSQIEAGTLTETSKNALRIFTLAMIVLTQVAITARQYVSTISEQIKNEKYVTGSAIENIDTEED